MLVFLDHLDTIDVPQVALAAQEVANRYWREGAGSAADLLTAKIFLLQYLHDRAQFESRDTRDSRHIRAVSCVLDVDGNDAMWADLTEWFSDWVRD